MSPEAIALRATALESAGRLACGDIDTSCELVADNTPPQWAACFEKVAQQTDCAELRYWMALCLAQP